MPGFVLQPFAIGPAQPPLTLEGCAARRTHELRIDYRLAGQLVDCDLPEQAAVPLRQDGLWESTCFELFFARRESASYWELNLSPAGHWNVYRFDSYRQGMREENGFSSLPFYTRRRPGLFHLYLELDLRSVNLVNCPLDAGVSAVVRDRSGVVYHYALSHPASRPDFHRREGFTLRL